MRLPAFVAQVVDGTVNDPAWWETVAKIATAFAAVGGALLVLIQLVRWADKVRFGRKAAAPFKWLGRTLFGDPLRVLIRSEVEHAVEAPIAEVRAQTVAVKDELTAKFDDHTRTEERVAKAILEAAVHIGAMRRQDADLVGQQVSDEVAEDRRAVLPEGQ